MLDAIIAWDGDYDRTDERGAAEAAVLQRLGTAELVRAASSAAPRLRQRFGSADNRRLARAAPALRRRGAGRRGQARLGFFDRGIWSQAVEPGP